MRIWLRFAISFFVLCLVIVAFAFLFGPGSFKQAYRDNKSPIGQLNENHQLTTPGQGAPQGSESATTSAPSGSGATEKAAQ